MVCSMGEANTDPRRPQTLESLYDAHGARMYRHALMVLANPAAAEDVVQQVFLKLAAMGPRPGLAEIENPEAYLRRAVRSECYRLLSRDRRRREDNRPLLEPVAPEVPNDDLREELESALRTLPPDQREAVHLKVYEGMSFEQIAAVMAVSINTAASRYRYAMQKLREILDENYR